MIKEAIQKKLGEIFNIDPKTIKVYPCPFKEHGDFSVNIRQILKVKKEE